LNIDTGVIRHLTPHGLERSLADAEVRALLMAREMLLPAKGPLSEKALRDKTPEDRVRILRAQEKRARRRSRNLTCSRRHQ
jgi:hypothetical protein